MPRTESLAMPRTESLAIQRTESLAMLRTESLAMLRTESLAMLRTESLAMLRTESLAIQQTESLAMLRTESLAMPEAVPASGRVRNFKVCGQVNTVSMSIILHGVDPLSYFSFQPVLHDWCNKGSGMCNPVCEMLHIKEPLLLIRKSSPCGGSGFPLSPSVWYCTICLTPYNRKYNVLSVSLNKTFLSFFPCP